jgi:hypothetical protein
MQKQHCNWVQGTAAERSGFDASILQKPSWWYETDSEDVFLWNGSTWAEIPAAGGANHNLLSSTHSDTVAASPPGEGSLIIGSAANKWTEFTAAGAAGYALVSTSTTMQWAAAPDWQGLHKYSAGLLVADDQSLYFGSDSDSAVYYDEASSNRVEVIGVDWAWFNDVLYLSSLMMEDNVPLYLGTNQDATILYDEAVDDQVKVTGASWDFAPAITFGSSVTVSEYVYHGGDPDTHVRFQDDQISLVCGGVVILDVIETGALGHYVDIPYRLRHAGDPDTCLEFPADDQMRLYCGNKIMLALVEGATDYVTCAVDFRINDDVGLVLGTDQDATILYDEATDDLVKVTGANWLFVPTLDINDEFTTYTHSLSVYESYLETTDGYYLTYFEVIKVGGNSNYADDLQGGYCRVQLNQPGGEIGYLTGWQGVAMVTDGSVGSATYNKWATGLYGVLNLDAGTVYGDGWAIQGLVDIESGATVTGDVACLYAKADIDGTVSGTSMMIYMEELSTNLTYGIYQSGNAPHFLGGPITVQDTSLTATADYYLFRGNVTKTDGATDYQDDFYGTRVDLRMNDASETFGFLIGGYWRAWLSGGEVGSETYPRDARGICGLVDLDAGVVWGDVVGVMAWIDQEAANTAKDDIFGVYCYIDADGSTDGEVYGFYQSGGSNIDYGYYQAVQNVKNRFNGSVGIRTDPFVASGGEVAFHAVGPTASSGTYEAAYTGAIFDSENCRLQVMSSNQGSWGSALHLCTAAHAWSWYSENTGASFYLGHYTQSADNQNISASSTILLQFDTSGNMLPGSAKSQDIGSAGTRWDSIFCVSCDQGTSRTVEAKRDCPVCGTRMRRGTGTSVIMGDDCDYLLAFCPNCGLAGMEEIRHLTALPVADPPQVRLLAVRVLPMGGTSYRVKLDFQYEDDQVVVVDDEPRTYRGRHNSTILGETEVAALLQMSRAEVRDFLLELGRHEWYVTEREEQRRVLMRERQRAVDVVVRDLVGTDLLLT